MSQQMNYDEIHGRYKTDAVKHMLTIQSEVRRALGEFLRSEGFTEIPAVIISPITDPLMHSVGEAKIDHYGHTYNLTKSMILHKQISLLTKDKIFAMSPNVRLEQPQYTESGRHLIEFTQVDLEVKDASRDDVMSIGERMLIHVLRSVKENCKEDLEFFGRSALKIPTAPFQRFGYLEILEKYGGDNPDDILSDHVSEPAWVIDFPKTHREFYDKEDMSRDNILLDMDMIYPDGFGEALSGGEREDNYEQILKRLDFNEIPHETYGLYLEFVKRGIPKSAGFGMGIERLTRYICGFKRIEDAALFPKQPGGLAL